MLEQELKNKIVNTISQYKIKCDKLEDEISVLKSAIYQLSLLPNGIYIGVDRQMHNLQTNIQENQDSSKIKKSVEHLVNAINALQKKKQENKARIGDFVKQGTSLLSKIIKAQDQSTFEQIESLLRADTNEQELLNNFMALLEESVQWIAEQLSQPAGIPITKKDSQEVSVNTQINARLSQLIEHLQIPEDFSPRLEALKSNLSQQLTLNSLTQVVDSLTDLVIEAFNLEHNQFKGFLNKFADYLRDFGSYLQVSNTNNLQSHEAGKTLETGLQENLIAIKNHIDQSQTIEELSTKIVGSLDLIAQQIKSFRDNEETRVKGYEEQVIALQAKLTEAESGVAKIKEQLSFQKVRINQDSLTGLPNRSAYDEYVLNAFHRWQRGFGDMTLAIADIDHFKDVNDQYGHLAGDKVLKKIATLFRSSLRAVDFVARYGGEEFVFIFEHTSDHDGWKVLDNLRQAIQETEFCYRDTRVVITASFGLTSLRHGDDIETLFVRADEAMYRAKHNGRNQVIMI
ncbi:Stalked cell differentiation-controlling protein [Legionella massiliensis]|uniref:diguanylate cyclase n=1 Tax=Legionella massiliensis TaxID=1034943 RepID=A0A078KXW3_9GAMM|nr:GGDEF domain-containing protein [Legionella massiliensis]CDZ77862.1 Stalked cell differentiation-controlling protein [Legionella massiliensis]CEE13600.1 Response regulator PleD [Legionella massiliensis]